MICPHCDNGVADSSNFCGVCGVALSLNIDSQQSPPQMALGLAPWKGGEVALGVFIMIMAMVLLAAVFLSLTDSDDTAIQVWASSNLMGLAILGVVWFLGMKSINADLRSTLRLLGLNSPRTNLRFSALLTMGTFAASFSAAWLFFTMMDWLNADWLAPPEYPPDMVFSGAASVFTFQALAVWTPITEEIFFRGFIFTGLVSRLGIWGAMGASALIFSSFHLDPENLGVLVPIFVTGLLLAGLYWLTGSLWPSIVAHAGQNAAALATAIFLV